MCLLALTVALLVCEPWLVAARLPAATAGADAHHGRLIEVERRELISNGSPAPPGR